MQLQSPGGDCCHCHTYSFLCYYIWCVCLAGAGEGEEDGMGKWGQCLAPPCSGQSLHWSAGEGRELTAHLEFSQELCCHGELKAFCTCTIQLKWEWPHSSHILHMQLTSGMIQMRETCFLKPQQEETCIKWHLSLLAPTQPAKELKERH